MERGWGVGGTVITAFNCPVSFYMGAVNAASGVGFFYFYFEKCDYGF